jgi:hypothetical protein
MADPPKARPRVVRPLEPRSFVRATYAFGRWWGTPAAFDLTVCLVFVVFSLFLFRGLLADPATHAIADNVNDQALIEWFLAYGVVIWKGDLSLVTHRLNSPDGINLMTNASHLLHGVIMAPVTVLFGAPVSFALLAALNLSATAAGWYLLMVRTLRWNRGGAILGAVLAGFGPGMIGQSNSHLHITAQWLLPLIVYLVIRLTRVTTRKSAVRTGVALGVVLAAQLVLGEEVLFLAMFTITLFGVLYVLRRRAWFRRRAARFGVGIAAAAGVSIVLCAYPIWTQLFGAQHTPNAPFSAQYFYADVASYVQYSPLSLAGPDTPSPLATSPSEYNTFLGWALVLLAIGLVIWCRRSATIFALGVTALIMGLLSFGPNVTADGERLGIPGLYSLIGRIPLIDAALPTRYALTLLPLIGLVIAFGIGRAWASPKPTVRWVVPVIAVSAILPTLPTPLKAAYRSPVPDFITSGAWRECVPEGGVLVPVPLPTPRSPDTMRWAAATGDAFGLPEGFFIGPYAGGGRSSVGTWKTPTSQLFDQVAESGEVPNLDAGAQTQAQKDLAFWHADCVALTHSANEAALRTTLENLLGPGTLNHGTWTWKISR